MSRFEIVQYRSDQPPTFFFFHCTLDLCRARARQRQLSFSSIRVSACYDYKKKLNLHQSILLLVVSI